jgi:ABC-type transport system involved in multi-copper enzyme maturation permease subunit
MFSAYLNSLQEGFAKRIAVVLLGLAVIFAFLTCYFTDPVPRPTAENRALTIAYVGGTVARPLVMASGIWIMIGLLAVAPLFSSTLEKGWIGLIFAKGKRRWQIFLARFLAGLTYFVVCICIADFPLAIKMWWNTGLPTWRIAEAVLLETLAFATLLAMAALVSLLQKGAAFPVLAGLSLWFFSPLLLNRKTFLFDVFTSNLARNFWDLIYRVMPKTDELHTMALTLVRTAKFEGWWPIWSTALFALAAIALTGWLLERKSF